MVRVWGARHQLVLLYGAIAAQIPLWSPERPALHDVVLASETDQISGRVGLRTIKTRGTDILLNDRPVFLRGICIYEENPMRGGRAYSVEDARMLLGWAKELNANFVRLEGAPPRHSGSRKRALTRNAGNRPLFNRGQP